MPAKHSCHIALTGLHEEWIDGQVVEGEYTSVSDLVRTAIRVLRMQDETRAAAGPAESIRPSRSNGRD